MAMAWIAGPAGRSITMRDVMIPSVYIDLFIGCVLIAKNKKCGTACLRPHCNS
jgi:hypothetical protein